MHTYRFAAVLFAVIAAAGCDNKAKPKDNLPTQPSPDPTPNANGTTPTAAVRAPTPADLAEYTKDIPGSGSKLLAKIDTSMGTFNCELYGDKAPMTVANFVGLATGKKSWMNPKTGKAETGTPYFNGIEFHRVIPGFMIQGGDPTASGTGGPGYMFNNEIWQGNAIEPGVLAMANTGRDGTNGSQFFILRGRREDLDKLHTVFGKCAELDLIDKIAAVPRGAQGPDRPNEAVKITNVTITKG